MALTVEVVRPLSEGRVQVDAKNKFFGKDIVNHYAVPEDKADEFIADYKKNGPNHNANGIVAGAITGGSLLLGAAASRNANLILKAASIMLFTAAGLLGSIVGIGVNNAKRLNKLFEKHDAAPMVFLKGENPEQAEKPAEEKKTEQTEK